MRAILLALLVIACPLARADKTIDAISTAANAAYMQTGMKANIDRELGHLQRMYIPKEVEKYGGTMAALVKTIMDRQLTLQWHF